MKQQERELQIETFKELQPTFFDLLTMFRGGSDISTKVMPEWREMIQKLYRFYDRTLPANFLDNSVVSHMLFQNCQGELMAHQIQFLERHFGTEDLKSILQESPIGQPPKALTWKYDTTHNSIHHAYHMARYEHRTSKSLSANRTVTEWGGGYGNFCKLMFQLPKSQLETYVIIDLPEISVLQCVYLSSVFGAHKINVVANPETDRDLKCHLSNTVQEGKINLISVPYLELLGDDHKSDLFVSTWGLSESPIEQQTFVDNRKWFGAESILLAIHQCGDHIPFMKESTNTGLLAKAAGAKVEDVQVIPGKNYYIFK